LLQPFQRITDRLSSNQKKFIAEVAGTFIVVVLATGSVVIDAETNGFLGIPFIAFAPFVGAWGREFLRDEVRVLKELLDKASLPLSLDLNDQFLTGLPAAWFPVVSVHQPWQVSSIHGKDAYRA
jgi:hypothetical protein